MTGTGAEQRPALTAEVPAAELRRWYWRVDELQEFARGLGLRASGGKQLLTRRIEASLRHEPFEEPPPRRGPGSPLVEPLTPSTTIPAGQRCTQQLRTWFVDQVGSGFRFDGHMRDFLARSDGFRTLAEAVQHWQRTRHAEDTGIDEQFELNRLARQWYETHPGGSRDEFLAAWRTYREQPLERRGHV